MSGLRFRLYVAGELVDEQWVDETEPGALAMAEKVARAQHDETRRRGKAWMVEVFNPDAALERAYLRFGTDTRGMLDPRPVDDLAGIADHLRGAYLDLGERR